MKIFRDLLTNIHAGARLALMLPVRREAFRVSVDQIVLLIAVDTLIGLAYDYIANGPAPIFNILSVGNAAALYLGLFLACYVIARIVRQAAGIVSFLVVLLAVTPAFWTVHIVLASTGAYALSAHDRVLDSPAFVGYSLWTLVVTYRAVRALSEAGIGRTLMTAAVYGACTVTPIYFLPAIQYGFWYQAAPATASKSTASTVNVEETYYLQRKLLRAATSGLAKERPGVTDLFFLGFGGDADDDVFLKEVRSVTQLFDRRFDTEDRSVMLINHENTVRTVPLANGHNLFHALQAIGRRMNKDEDVLFLFMTSHGDREHNLSVRFGRLQLNSMPASYVRRVLDSTGIKWRVIVVSACFSGGFIDHLKDEHTLIMTAARRDRTSFGCGDAFDFTYFGQAYFDEALRRTYSFTEAFDMARSSIAAREKQEDITASEPQIFIGGKIAPKLEALEGRFVALGRKSPPSPLTNATAR